jgi:hypothetical protein
MLNLSHTAPSKLLDMSRRGPQVSNTARHRGFLGVETFP